MEEETAKNFRTALTLISGIARTCNLVISSHKHCVLLSERLSASCSLILYLQQQQQKEEKQNSFLNNFSSKFLKVVSDAKTLIEEFLPVTVIQSSSSSSSTAETTSSPLKFQQYQLWLLEKQKQNIITTSNKEKEKQEEESGLIVSNPSQLFRKIHNSFSAVLRKTEEEINDMNVESTTTTTDISDVVGSLLNQIPKAPSAENLRDDLRDELFQMSILLANPSSAAAASSSSTLSLSSPTKENSNNNINNERNYDYLDEIEIDEDSKEIFRRNKICLDFVLKNYIIQKKNFTKQDCLLLNIPFADVQRFFVSVDKRIETVKEKWNSRRNIGNNNNCNNNNNFTSHPFLKKLFSVYFASSSSSCSSSLLQKSLEFLFSNEFSFSSNEFWNFSVEDLFVILCSSSSSTTTTFDDSSIFSVAKKVFQSIQYLKQEEHWESLQRFFDDDHDSNDNSVTSSSETTKNYIVEIFTTHNYTQRSLLDFLSSKEIQQEQETIFEKLENVFLTENFVSLALASVRVKRSETLILWCSLLKNFSLLCRMLPIIISSSSSSSFEQKEKYLTKNKELIQYLIQIDDNNNQRKEGEAQNTKTSLIISSPEIAKIFFETITNICYRNTFNAIQFLKFSSSSSSGGGRTNNLKLFIRLFPIVMKSNDAIFQWLQSIFWTIAKKSNIEEDDEDDGDEEGNIFCCFFGEETKKLVSLLELTKRFFLIEQEQQQHESNETTTTIPITTILDTISQILKKLKEQEVEFTNNNNHNNVHAHPNRA